MYGLMLALLAFAALAAGPALGWVRAVPPMVALGVFAASAPLGLAAAAAGAWSAYAHGMSLSVGIALAGLVPVFVLAIAAVPALRYPRINDVTTNPYDPPLFAHAATLPENRGRDMSFPSGTATAMAEAYGDLAPQRVPLDPDAAFARALHVAQSKLGWTITHRETTAWAFEAVETTRVFGFRDDVVVRVRPIAVHESQVDIRSKSRDGTSDLGANAIRIRRYLTALDEDLRTTSNH